MFGTAGAIYLATRKKHDQLWNTYVMRPLAAGVVAVIAGTPITPNQLSLLNLFLFMVGAGVLIAFPSRDGSLVAVALIELSYLFDCADGMLARHKKIASKTGHLLDFFIDECKATVLPGALALFLYQRGGFSFLRLAWGGQDPRFLMLGLASGIVVASGLALTSFVRRPELSGQETSVEAHYEANPEAKPQSPVRAVASLVLTFLRFVNHYPSHIWVWALVGRLDVFLVVYTMLNALYLAKGWLGLVVRFGRFDSK